MVLDWDSGLGVKGLSTVGHFFLFTLSGQILKCDSEAFANDLHVIPCSFAFVLMCTIRK